MKHGLAIMAATAIMLTAAPFVSAEAESGYPRESPYTGVELLNPDLYYTSVEEPALRPAKAFIRGLGSVVYNTVGSFVRGNENFPVVGSVEAFRGLRRGSIELVEGTYRSMAGSEPRRVRELGPVNEYIEDDLFLHHASDTVTAGVFYAVGFGRAADNATYWALGTQAAQQVTDLEPFHPERMEERRIEREREREMEEERARPAQARYLSDDMRASNRNRERDGNLLRTARQRD